MVKIRQVQLELIQTLEIEWARKEFARMNILLNSLLFFGLMVVGGSSVYVLSRYKFKRSIPVSIILAVFSLLFFAWLGLFILGLFGRL